MTGERRNGSVGRFLRTLSGRIVVVLAIFTGLGGAVLVGDDGLVFMFGVFAVVVVTDGVSIYLWDRLDPYFERREANREEPTRELTPHRLSRTTKIVAVIGTVMIGMYLLFALLISYLV